VSPLLSQSSNQLPDRIHHAARVRTIGPRLVGAVTLVCALLQPLLTGTVLAGDEFAPERMHLGKPRSVGPGVNYIPLGIEADASTRVAAVDINGDGKDEILVASEKQVIVIRYGGYRDSFIVWRTASRGGATSSASGDLDGDSQSDAVIGWGAHRSQPNAPAVLVAYRTLGPQGQSLIEEVIAKPKTSRAAFTSIQIRPIERDGPVGVLYAHFTSKYDAAGAFAHVKLTDNDAKATWIHRKLHQRRMATQLTAGLFGPDDEQMSIVVGRVYGDATKLPGDVYRLEPNGKRALLPSVRGVRSLGAFVLGSSKSPRYRICYGDGWHRRYRDQAKAIVTCALRNSDGEIETEVLDRLPGSEVSDLASADMDGDGVTELIAAGSRSLYRFLPVVAIDGFETWDPRIIGPGGRQFTVIDVDGDGIDEIALGGEEPALIIVR
jgi:hypothetical protein